MVYLITTATLIATVAAFFLWVRRGLFAFGWLQWVLRVIAVLPLLASGVLHFTRTALMASIIPPYFPDRPQLVLITGVFEFAGALGLLLPAFTRVASACLAVFMIAIFPANVYAAGQTVGGLHMPSVLNSFVHASRLHLLVAHRGLGNSRAPAVQRQLKSPSVRLGHEPHGVGNSRIERLLDHLQVQELLVHAGPPRWIEPP
jgi:uncharacterized membrane protein